MMNVLIRQVEADDLAAVTQVEAECFPEAEAADEESFEKRIETFPESFFVAADRGRVIGFINGAVTDERTIRDEMFADSRLHSRDGAYQSVFGLAVLKDYQHKGIAASLMERLIEAAKIRGKGGVILTCKEKLISFYGQFGFVSLGVSDSVHGGAVWYDMILEF